MTVSLRRRKPHTISASCSATTSSASTPGAYFSATLGSVNDVADAFAGRDPRIVLEQ